MSELEWMEVVMTASAILAAWGISKWAIYWHAKYISDNAKKIKEEVKK